MSIYYICGEVKIPTNDLATVRRHYRTLHNKFNEKIYRQAKGFRKKYYTRSEKKWAKSLENGLNNALRQKIGSAIVALQFYKKLDSNQSIKRTDFDNTPYGFKSVQDDEFPIFSNTGEVIGRIWFEDRVLKWYVPGENIEEYLETVQSAFIHKVFNTITWVRNNGGGETLYVEGMEKPETTKTYGPEGKKYEAVESIEMFLL